MIFFSEKKLARKLHEGQVTEKEQMIYLSLYVMTCAIFTTLSFGHAANYNMSVNIYSYLYDLVTLTFILGTIIYSSIINKLGDGKDIIARYICITVPLVIKFAPLFFIIMSIGYALDNFLNMTKTAALENQQDVDAFLDQAPQEGPFTVLMNVLIYSFLLWRYKVAFQIASGKVELK